MSERSKSDTDFMPALKAAEHMTLAPGSNLLLYAVALLIVFFFLWAGLSEVDELTRGEGQVVPSQEVKIIQSLEGGILSELLVHEGDIVKEDQIVARISDVDFASEEQGTEAHFLSLLAQKARLQAEAEGKKLVMPEEIEQKTPNIAQNEVALYESRQKEFKNELSILDENIKKTQADLDEVKAQISRHSGNVSLLGEELAMTQRMVAQKAASKMEAIRLKRKVNDETGALKAAKERKIGLEADLQSIRKKREDRFDKFRTQALGDLNIVETKIAKLQQSLKSMGDRVFRAELRAPVDGIVNKIALKTEGGVVEPAMRLMEIVPVDDDLKVMARVQPNDIAFLKVGQPAKVKITAYDSVRYGALDGTLTRVGASSVMDHEGNISFEVEVVTNKNHLGTKEHPLPITPGMVAQIEIMTGRHTILEYLGKPILRARERAFTER